MNKIKNTYPGKHGAKYTKTDENAKNYIKVVDRLIEKAQRRYDESMANLEKDTTYKAGVRHNDLQNALNSKIDIFNQSGKLDEKTAAEKEIDKLNKDLVELETERYNKSIPDSKMIDSWIEQKYDQDQVKLDKEEMEVDNAYMDVCMVADDINLKKKEMEDLKRDTYLKCNRAFIEIKEKYERDKIKNDEYEQIQARIRNSKDALDCDFDRLMDDPAKNMEELDVKIKGCEVTAKQLKADHKAAKQGMENNSEEAYNNAMAEANRALEINRKVKTEMEQKIKDLNDLHTLHNTYATKTEKAIAQYDTFKKDRKQLTATNISSMCGKYLRDYGKSRSWIHKLSSDSGEYKAIKTQLEKLQDPEAVKAMSSTQINKTLTDLKTACDNYLIAKRAQDEETFRIEALSTNQRTYRIFFAKTVMEYCTNQLNANKDIKLNLGAGADGYMQRHQENPAKVTNNMDTLLKQIKKAGSDKKLPKPDPEIKVNDRMRLQRLAIKAPM